MHFNETLAEVNSPAAASRDAHKEISEAATEVQGGVAGRGEMRGGVRRRGEE